MYLSSAITVGTTCLFVACALTAGCKETKESCDQAQAAAFDAWQAYLAKIEPDQRKVAEIQRKSETAMAFEIEKRISKIAMEKADQRFDRAGGAWHRAYESAKNAACQQDKECANTKLRITAAKRKSEELQERIEAAKAARDAAKGSAKKAVSAARRVTDDFANKELVRAARVASKEAWDACRDIKP